MGSIIVFALVTLWLVAMVPAVVLPLFADRPNKSANQTPSTATIQFRQQTASGSDRRPPIDRSAA